MISKLKQEIRAMQEDAARRYEELRVEVEKITGVKIRVEGDLSQEMTVSSSLKDEIARLLATIEELKKVASLNQASAARMAMLEDEIKRLQGEIMRLERGNLTFTSAWESAIDTQPQAWSTNPNPNPNPSPNPNPNQRLGALRALLQVALETE